MNCPICNTPDIEIGNSGVCTKDYEIQVHYALCNKCMFFIVREDYERVIGEIEKRRMK